MLYGCTTPFLLKLYDDFASRKANMPLIFSVSFRFLQDGDEQAPSHCSPSVSHSLIEHMDSEVFSSDEELSVYILRNFRGMLEKRVHLDDRVNHTVTG